MRSNKGFLQLRRLEAARDIATLLSESGNKVMLDAQTLLLNGKLLQWKAILKRRLIYRLFHSHERRHEGIAQV